ncbi:hypothetical protein [Anaeromyxobacter diazotrophicus]|uniref:Uncharacterized protein n=1 Tax=Anaeromyxobacter diazotrophicus TaxID=2590199 RepID=A0A7I9VJV2_9BACT|nr:hypothetical protein [Anaeromyxobacter diazotrophicus]GEJ56684.1 hypothetical protein AMYX_14250 [Anaeromyxobacter diazotrophicus]
MPTRSLTLAAALLLPALALAAPPRPPPAGAGDIADRAEQVKRQRLTRALGLAEALDLDEAGALKLRDTLAKHDEKRAPLQRQLQESLRTLRAAARGEGSQAAQVDGAVQRLAEVRAKLAQLDGELLGEVTRGATPARKARAALFLARPPSRPPPGAGPTAGAAAGPRAAAPPGPRGYPPRPPPSYTPAPPGVPSQGPAPMGPPDEIEPPHAPPPGGAPAAPAPGVAGPEAEDWFSDSP